LRILVTGGAGFVGSNLARKLSSLGHDLTIVDSLKYGYTHNLSGLDSTTFIHSDLRDLNLIELMQKIDVVFHFAGISSLPECESNPSEAFSVNTTLVASLLHAVRFSNVKRFIFSSTSAVYENNAEVPFLESHTVSPNLVYSMTKQSAENLCLAFFQNYGLEAVICRFFNVYGPNQDFLRRFPPFTSYIVREVLAGRVPVIYNSEPISRDYMFIDDLVEILVRMLNHPDLIGGEIYNLCSAFTYTPVEILNILSLIAKGKNDFIIGDPRKFWLKEESLFESIYALSETRISKEVYKQSVGSNQKMRDNFGFTPTITMETGLQKILDFQKGV
jgi:UDP-glucose 4-epimerase